jgi:hypothetical protein
MENSSIWTELFARDNCDPRRNNANDAHRWHGGSDGRLLGRALEGQQSRPVQDVHRARTRHPPKVRRQIQDPRGPEKFHRFVVIEFPSFEKAVPCHESVEYVEAAVRRKKYGASELEIVIIESI